MDHIAVLKLGNGRAIHCKNFDAAKSLWAREHSKEEDAIIEVLLPVGLAGIVAAYRYDSEAGKWVHIG